MAVWTYSGNVYNSSPAGTTTFPLVSGAGYKIDYLQRSHIHVSSSVDEGYTWIELTASTDYNLNTEGTEVVLAVGIADGTFIKVQRQTPYLDEYVNFQSSSLLTADQLNTAELFSMYVDQEQADQIGSLSEIAIKYLGAVDLTVDSPPLIPNGGDFFINTGSGLVLDSWTGIGGDAVVGSEQVVYNSLISEWQIFAVPSSQIGVVEVTGTSPIEVDSTDNQRPEVSITAATDAAAGSMSAADKAKLDGIPADVDSKFVEIAGDNMTGDLTLGTNNITLNAADGSITAAGRCNIGSSASPVADNFAIAAVNDSSGSAAIFAKNVNSNGELVSLYSSDNTFAVIVENDGSITAAGDIIAKNNDDNLVQISSLGYGVFRRTRGSLIQGINADDVTVDIQADGSASFNGKVTSASTETNDSGTTLVTKDYIDSIPAGGVTKIVAGNNVTISPSSGTGVVTVNSTGGGTGGTTKADIYGTAKAWGSGFGDGSGVTTYGCTLTRDLGQTGYWTVVFNTPQPSDEYAVAVLYAANISNKTVNGFNLQTFSVGGDAFNGEVGFTIHNNEPAEIIVGSGTVANTNIYGTAKASASVQNNKTNGIQVLLSSYNIASVTRTGLGVLDVVFSTPMTTSNYVVNISTYGFNSFGTSLFYNKTTSGFTIYTGYVTDNSIFFDYSFDFTVHDNTPAEVALTTFGDVINYSGAAAWGSVDINGTLLNGLNVAPISFDGTTYTVTFLSPMPSDNYSLVATSSQTSIYIVTGSQNANGFQVVPVGATGVPAAASFSFTVNAFNALPPKGGTGTDAWALVNATGTDDASFNCTVTSAGTGVRDVVFNDPLPTANYAVMVGGTRANLIENRTTTGFRITVYTSNGVVENTEFSFAVNATNATLPSTITQEEADLIIDTIKGGGVAQKVAILTDVKPSGTGGGSSIAGWQDRTLNTIVSDTGNLVTLANDKEFTLKAGTYLIEWSAPGYFTARHQTKLVNVTSGSVEQLGSSEIANANEEVQSRSFGSVRVNITSDTTYKIEQYCDKAYASFGLGVSSINSGDSIYTQVTITDLAVLAAGGGGGGGGGGSATVGEIVAWASPDVPTGWLECDGSPIPAQYSSLIALVGANTPDLRGEFIRGWDNGAGVDSGRSLLSSQGWQYSEHNHTAIDPGHSHPVPNLSSSGSVWPNTVAGGSSITLSNWDSGKVGTGVTVSVEGGAENSGETRPSNVALMYIINADGSGGGGDSSLWKRDGTTLKPANDGDAVDIGSGNVTLYANGGATFLGGTKNFQITDNYLSNYSVGLVANNGSLVLGASGGIALGNGLADTTSSGGIPLQVFAENGASRIYRFTSLRAAKTNIQSLPSVWDKLKALNPCSFNGIGEHDSNINSFGFIAEEVDAVDSHFGTRDETGLTGVSYPAITVALTATLKEALTRIEELEAKVQTLETN